MKRDKSDRIDKEIYDIAFPKQYCTSVNVKKKSLNEDTGIHANSDNIENTLRHEKHQT